MSTVYQKFSPFESQSLDNKAFYQVIEPLMIALLTTNYFPHVVGSQIARIDMMMMLIPAHDNTCIWILDLFRGGNLLFVSTVEWL